MPWLNIKKKPSQRTATVANFADKFMERADKRIFARLGDAVTVKLPDGSEHPIRCTFDYQVESDQLTDRFVDSHATLDVVHRDDAHYFDDVKEVIVTYRGTDYSVLEFKPIRDSHYFAILRVKRV